MRPAVNSTVRRPEIQCVGKPKVAFVCVHNSCRSQIAEALDRKLALDVFESYSAGTELKDHIITPELEHRKSGCVERKRRPYQSNVVRYLKAKNPDVAQSVLDMVPLYLSEGKAEGVRGDIAFAQSCLETGKRCCGLFFRYGF